MLSSCLAYLKISAFLETRQSKLRARDYFSLIADRFLRLAPAYYFVFFFGWLVGPYLGSGPWWYTYEKNFADCHEHWWMVLLMANNFTPGYVIANEGCFYWGWYVACDFQLFLVIPFLVSLFYKRKSMANLGIFMVLAIGTAINYYVIYKNNFSAGLFAP